MDPNKERRDPPTCNLTMRRVYAEIAASSDAKPRIRRVLRVYFSYLLIRQFIKEIWMTNAFRHGSLQLYERKIAAV